MDDVTRKKLNLLVHLAKIDGRFDETEKEVLANLLSDAGLSDSLVTDKVLPVDLNDFKEVPTKTDILYWALRIIKADGIIHPDEAAYCKALAVKLNYKSEVVDYFTNHDLGERADFIASARLFAAKSV
ncbi:hypothetical protein SanaruYs_25810 [Chryseotalea sanaruensis]|uniref:TerB family tellurite resistance protein n=1 Tax=Chryseotalea sanaruensis TaxID=2482724 RepID=A0A401UBV3_9BACT|nr:TerB family tellurite resistance protein [Chryseotalea sanaruensis]GCC52344.1 hypothetical protein SanaruYs_25810 [Chryseotalea sanaruensis]